MQAVDYATVAPPVAAEALARNIKALSLKDQAFASSLLQARIDGKASPKQWHWIRTLAARATAPKAEGGPTALNAAGVFEAFQRAGANLKNPRVLITAEGQTLRLTVIKSGANAGAVAVTDTADWDDRRYFGRVTASGEFVAAHKEAASRLPVWNALVAFGADPAGTAAAYGKATGSCCFCAKELTDPVSVELGYGPVCAKNWGLAH